MDGSDATVLKNDFGRSIFKNPCPPDGPAPLPRTGQTTSYTPGDAGALQRGVGWSEPRFTDNEDGTIKDNLTRLIWLKMLIVLDIEHGVTRCLIVMDCQTEVVILAMVPALESGGYPIGGSFLA